MFQVVVAFLNFFNEVVVVDQEFQRCQDRRNVHVIYQTRETAFRTFSNSERRVEEYFDEIQEFGSVMKQSFECLIYLLNRNKIKE